jgi:ABC-type uncharacterized transport system substrate-binding protein
MRVIGLVVLAASLALTPLATGAQPGKVTVYRIGLLSYRGCPASIGPFRKGLGELGYVEGRNLAIECRDAPGRVDRFPDLARQLVSINIDVLVAEGTPASLAAKRATTAIPIVMVGVLDPEGSGLIARLARPGGNVTGPSLFPTLELASKVLQLTKEVVPHISRIAVLRDATNPVHLRLDDSMVAAARGLGIKPQFINIRAATDLHIAFTEIVDQRVQGLLVYPVPLAPTDSQAIAEFALAKKLPGVTFWEGYVEHGFLLFYGTRLAEEYRRAGVYIDKILKGAKPGDLPVLRQNYVRRQVVDLSALIREDPDSMITLLLHLLRLLPFLFGGHRYLALENLALRQQLAVYKQTGTRPKLCTKDRLFWVALARVWAGWRRSLVIVTPDTVLRWRRRRLREHWTNLSGRPTRDRPRVNPEIAALVTRMAAANPLWGAPRIHGELLKLGFRVAERTVSRLIPKRRTPPSQTWRTFLTNHVPDLVSIDFLTVPPRAFASCSSSWCSLTIVGASSTSTSPSIPALLGRPSRSWTPSPTIPLRPISSAIATQYTAMRSANA